MTMKYYALTSEARYGGKPDGLARYDTQTMIPSYFARSTQDWVPDADLFDMVVGRSGFQDGYLITEAYAEEIRTTILAPRQ